MPQPRVMSRTTAHREATPSPARIRLGYRWGLAAVAAFLAAVPLLTLLLLVRSRNGALVGLDADVARAAYDWVAPRPAVEAALEVVADVLHPNVFRLAAVAGVVLLWRRGRRRVAAWLAVTMIIGGCLGGLLKLAVERARPAFEEPIAVAGGYSFPSGHALNSMLGAACFLVLVHPATRGAARAACWALAVAVVLLVGLDRIGLGVHYLSDVVAVWIVALATVAATVSAFALWRREEGLPAPTADAGLDPEH